MTPTPAPHATFQDGSRFNYAGRRRPARNPYDVSHQTPPNAQTPITPLPDNGVEGELSDNEVDVQDGEAGEDIEGEEEIEGEENDIDADEDEDEEGGIEEGASRFYFYLPYEDVSIQLSLCYHLGGNNAPFTFPTVHASPFRILHLPATTTAW